MKSLKYACFRDVSINPAMKWNILFCTGQRPREIVKPIQNSSGFPFCWKDRKQFFICCSLFVPLFLFCLFCSLASELKPLYWAGFSDAVVQSKEKVLAGTSFPCRCSSVPVASLLCSSGSVFSPLFEVGNKTYFGCYAGCRTWHHHAIPVWWAEQEPSLCADARWHYW